MQTKLQSLAEAVFGTLIGLLVAIASNWLVLPLFGFPVNLSQSFWIAVIFTAVSILRSFLVRRLFNWIHQ